MIAAGKSAKAPALEVSGDLEPMLTRLKLTAIRDQLDTLLDQAGRAELNLREALSMLCAAEVARKDERRIQMGMSIAKFPCVRTLEGFEYEAQPSVDPKQIRELATSIGSATATACCCSARPEWARRTWPWRSDARPSCVAIPR
nr:ATP-binding protein [Variovorax sp. KK3]